MPAIVFETGMFGHSLVMTNVTTTLTLKSAIADLLTNKNDVQILVKFLDTKGFISDPAQKPIYERLVTLLKSTDTNAIHSN